MKKICAAVITALLFTSCVYQADRRPVSSNELVWICEEPYAEFYWEKGGDVYTGKIIANGEEQNIFHREDYGAYLWAYSIEGREVARDLEEIEQYLLFYGRADYNYDSFTLQVKEDYVNMFNGELPLLKFKCYKKADYFKEKQDE